MDIISFLLIIFFVIKSPLTECRINCDGQICGSVVSKCMLNKNCDCQVPLKCTSFKSCKKCLDKLYLDCCQCIGMCPEESTRDSIESVVYEFNGDSPIFTSLAESPDNELYTTYSNGEVLSSESNIGEEKKCMATFWNTCLSNKKCETACEIMGAKTSRWFLDGCCQCIGGKCISSGFNERKCISCPDELDVELEEFAYSNFDLDQLDFGENSELMSVKSKVGEFPRPTLNFPSFTNYYDKRLTVHEIQFSQIHTLKCVLVYINNCMSPSSCIKNCQGMGGTSYRVFADGCCECIGSTCPMHGSDESKCKFDRNSCYIENVPDNYLYKSNDKYYYE